MRVLKSTMEDLDPRAAVSMRFQCPDGEMKKLEIGTRRRERERVMESAAPAGRERTVGDAIPERSALAARAPHLKLIGDSVVVWKLPRFDLSAKETGRVMETVGGSRALILDLRDNPGGYITSLLALSGYFFDGDVTLFRSKGRTGEDSVVAHSSGRPYRGKVVVLIDSRSGSSSEIFARAMQFYGRGVVIGDVSCGSVMEAMYRQHAVGADDVVVYGAVITVAAITLPDGRPLEGRGIVPDEIILPAPRDIALGLDPVMSRATERAGVPLDGWRAGKLFTAARAAGSP
jgi:C-terminal processing protease CtpA/Prc